MKNKSILLTACSSLVCFIIIFYLYTSDGNKNKMYILIPIALGSVVCYKLNKKWFNKQKNELINKESWDYPPTIKLKKKYIIAFSIVALFLYKLFEQVFQTEDDSKNQEALYAYYHDVSMIEGTLNSGVFTPIVEEILFRGLLLILISSIGLLIIEKLPINYQLKMKYVFNIVFVIIATIIFGYIHVMFAGDYDKIYPYLFSGLILSTAYILTKTLYVSTLIHMLSNTMVALATYNGYILNCLIILLILYMIYIVTTGIYINRYYFGRILEKSERRNEKNNNSSFLKTVKDMIVFIKHVNKCIFYKSK